MYIRGFLILKHKTMNKMNKSTTDMLKDWCKLVEQQKNNEDVWSTIPEFPQIRFKNLKIESSFETTEETNEITLTFMYDDFESNDKIKSRL